MAASVIRMRPYCRKICKPCRPVSTNRLPKPHLWAATAGFPPIHHSRRWCRWFARQRMFAREPKPGLNKFSSGCGIWVQLIFAWNRSAQAGNSTDSSAKCRWAALPSVVKRRRPGRLPCDISRLLRKSPCKRWKMCWPRSRHGLAHDSQSFG